MIINWKAARSTPMASFFRLDKGSETLKKTRDRLKDSSVWLTYSKFSQYQINSSLNQLEKFFGPDKDLYSLTLGEFKLCIAENFGRKAKLVRALIKLYGVLSNNIKPSQKPKENKNQEFMLEIIEADESTLSDFIENGRYNGRFGPLKLAVREALISCPSDQYRIIPWSPNMINDDKERQATLNAIRDVLNFDMVVKKRNLKCFQSFGKKSFYICRDEQRERIKKLMMSGGLNATRLSSRNGDSREVRKNKTKD